MAEMSSNRYLYMVHDPEEGLEAFAFQGPVRLSRKLPGKRIPYRSPSLPSIQDQDAFFTHLNSHPLTAAAHWLAQGTDPGPDAVEDPGC
ncbi:MAG: hypothetical protein ACAI44_30185 [Candidatus Sericytochromatia bacterium]